MNTMNTEKDYDKVHTITFTRSTKFIFYSYVK